MKEFVLSITQSGGQKIVVWLWPWAVRGFVVTFSLVHIEESGMDNHKSMPLFDRQNI